MNKAEFLKKYQKPKYACNFTDMGDDLDQYADEQSREEAIKFAGFYYDSVADDPTPKEITPEILYDEFNQEGE